MLMVRPSVPVPMSPLHQQAPNISPYSSWQPITAAVWTPGSLRPGRPAPSASSLFIEVLGMRSRRKKLRGKMVMRKGNQGTILPQSGPHFWALAPQFPPLLAPCPQPLLFPLGLQQIPHPLLPLQLPSWSNTRLMTPSLVTYFAQPLSLFYVEGWTFFP